MACTIALPSVVVGICFNILTLGLFTLVINTIMLYEMRCLLQR